MQISDAAVDLILRFEGWDVPWEWPGDASGITIPYGYDLGYERDFRGDWGGVLDSETIDALEPAVGITGERANAIRHDFVGVHIPKEAARYVFENVTIPRQEALTIRTFPGAENLPADALGGLVSLIYNRGPGLLDRPGAKPRGEMRAIRDLLAAGELQGTELCNAIADQVEAQAQYWRDNPNSDGDLHDRRLAEAALIRQAAAA